MTAARFARGVIVGLAATVAACVPEETGDFALCCTCLDQKSPQNIDADAVDQSTNCLPDTAAEPGGAVEVDGCNEQAAAQIVEPATAGPIFIVDEQCTVTTCLDECRGAGLRGAVFEVREESLTQ